MSVPVIAFLSNMGGVGKTTLVYHLAWMFSDLGVRVLAADLDPQANLTAAFVEEQMLEIIWGDDQPPVSSTGDIETAIPVTVSDNLALLPGKLQLSAFEDELSSAWSAALSGNDHAFRVLSAFWHMMQDAAVSPGADIVLVDLAPNLGFINRAAIIAADYVVIPLSPDLFSLQGLRNLGPVFAKWRAEWRDHLDRKPNMNIDLPAGRIIPLGYVVMQHSVRLDRPVKEYDRWINRIPGDYRKYVLLEAPAGHPSIQDDPYMLAVLKPYLSLMPMAQEARKPMFHLKPADGAIGAHLQLAQEAYKDFRKFALAIASRIELQADLEPEL